MSRRGAPVGHEKPERRDSRAESHFCEAVGSTVYCSWNQCSRCCEGAKRRDGSRRVYRVYDSRGTVEVTPTEARARSFRASGYPVEVWDVDPGAESRVRDLSGGSGPAFLPGGGGERVGELEVEEAEDR